MDTKLEARGQFPASFPDTFKNFFAMMNEDEDHVGLFANLLEDKVIPRQNSPVQPQRQRYGGSMRSHSGGDRSDRRGRAERQYQQQLQNQQQQQQQRGYQSRSRSGSGSGVDLFANRNVSFSNSSSRVNSLRRNRSRGSLTLSSNGLNALGLGPVTLAPNVSSSSSGSVLDLTVPGASVIGDPGGEVRDGIEGREGRDGRGGLGGSRSNLYPSPSKTSLKPSLKTSTSTVERGCALFLGIDDGLQHLQQQLKGQQPGTSQKHVTLACCECVCGSSKAARSGPDGEDNCGANYPKGYAGGYMLPSTPKSKTIDKTSTYTSAELAASKNKNLQERQERQEKRGSVILERAFDFDASCDESDSISSSTHNPVPSPAPHQPAYNVLKPILKQPQQKTMLQQQQQQQQHQQTVNVQQNQGANHQQYQQVAHQHHQGVALQQQQHQVVTHQPHQQQVNQQDYDQVNHQQHQQVSHQQNQQVNHQQHQQVIHQQHQGVNQQQMIHQQHQMVTHPPHHHQQVAHQQLPTPGVHVHRLLPTPPTHSGKGAFHTREAALQRVQQQSGYYNQGPSTSASAYGYNQSMEHQQMQQQLQYDQHQHQQDLQFEQHQTPHQARQLYSDDTELDYDTEWELDEEPAPEIVPPLSTFSDFVNAAQNPTGSRQSLRAQKSPILNRRRASSIAGNLLHSDYNYTRNSIGGAPIDSNDFQRISHSSSARDRMSLAGVLTFQQAMSGAVSPQYGTVGSLNPQASGSGEKKPGMVGADAMGGGGLPGGSSHNINLTVGLGFLGGSNTTLAAVAEVTSGPDGNGDSTDSPSPVSMIPSKQQQQQQQQQQQKQQQLLELQMQQEREDLPTHLPMKRERGVGESSGASTSGTAIADLAASVVLASHSGKPLTERQRLRTSSMPAESRRPRLAEMRRSAIHAGDPDMTYYRLRSFSITSHGICNLGDSLRSRRSRSINSVTSTGTSNSGVDRHNSNASGASGEVIDGDPNVPAYKIAMLGGSGVGKTTLTYQFTTSDYICAYDLSLDDDYGQKTVSVLVDNIETDLEIIDHPACEMSTEAFCATYNIDLFVVVYSVIDRNTFAAAERVLQYLKENEMLLSRGAILVANKTDLQRHRVVTRQMGRKVAKDIACKFIETSSGLDHNVDELLVGIVAQVKLNPQRLRLLTELELQRLNLQSTIQKHRGMHLQSRRMVRQMSICQGDEEIFDGGLSERLQNDDENNDPDGVPSTSRASRSRIENPNRKPLNLESILKMGESEVDDDEDVVKTSQLSKFNMLAATIRHRRPFRKRRSFDGGVSTSAAADAAAELQRRYQLRAMDDLQLEGRLAAEDRFGDRNGGLAESEDEEAGEDGVVEDGRRNTCNRKVVKKLTARTKVFISSVLRFKKSISLKRRNSSSCSDLFVI